MALRERPSGERRQAGRPLLGGSSVTGPLASAASTALRAVHFDPRETARRDRDALLASHTKVLAGLRGTHRLTPQCRQFRVRTHKRRMRFSGRLKSWNPERGFGFIESDGGGQEVFAHISAIPVRLRPPQPGQAFTFEVELNREGKKRAANIGVAEAPRAASRPRREAPAQWSLASALAIPVFVVIYAVVTAKYSVSPWFALAYIALGVVSLMVYAFDKSAAAAGRWRSSEQSLLALSLLSGWPGGLVAQQLLRHKSSKASFRQAFWVTVVLNVGAFVLYHVVVKPPVQ